MSAPEEYADPKLCLAVASLIQPGGLTEEDAMRLLYPQAAAEIYTPWHRSNMVPKLGVK